MTAQVQSSSKTIPIALLLQQEGVHRCAYEDWYLFRTCTVASCKNYTERTPTKCLAVDRQSPVNGKVISDAELRLYKYSHVDTSTRNVSLKRKTAVDRVRAVIRLRMFLQYIDDSFHAEDINRRFVSKILRKAARRKPLKLSAVGFRPHMWARVVDEDLYARFSKNDTEFPLHSLLFLHKEQLAALRDEVHQCES